MEDEIKRVPFYASDPGFEYWADLCIKAGKVSTGTCICHVIGNQRFPVWGCPMNHQEEK